MNKCLKNQYPNSIRGKMILDLSKQLFFIFSKLGFTPCKAEQPLRNMELQEKESQKDQNIQEICLKRTYS